MRSRIHKTFFLLTVVLFFFLSLFGFGLSAQKSNNEICQSLEEIEKQCDKLSAKDCQVLLEKCKDYYEQKAAEYKSAITKTEAQEKTFQNQVYIYENKISQLNNLIYKNSLMIKDLGLQAQDTQTSIEKTLADIEDTKEKLAEILRQIYEEDQRSMLEILLAGQDFSEFFENLAALEGIGVKNKEVLEKIKNLHDYLTEQKGKLEDEKESLERIVMVKKLQREESETLKSEKERLLRETKGEKRLYQEYLAQAQEKAAEIRKRIFELAQVPETEAPTLEEAYKLAVYVEGLTGARPAFLLGLLTVESAIGKNVGQCNCVPGPGCLHPEIHYKEIMRQGQWSYFLEITKELGLDPNTTPVSCAVNGGKVQWGGAMGPAQFMPATWSRYKERVEKLLRPNEKPASPWRIKDAFLAAGLYLSDWRAGSQKLQDEIGAATAYLCGTSRMTSRCKAAGGQGYRYLVFKYASEYQQYVDEGVFK